MIFAGIVSLLSLVTLRHLGGTAGTHGSALVMTAASHVAVYNWTFLLGQSLMPGLNALLLGSLLVPVPAGAPHHSPGGTHRRPHSHPGVIATLFGGIEQGSSWAALTALPVAAWGALARTLALVVKGFRPSPTTAGLAARGAPSAEHGVPAQS